MNKENRDEGAAREEEHRTCWSGFTIAIGQALQRAAGLSASGPLLTQENPWLADSGGAHPPILDTAIKEILRASIRCPDWKNPRAAEAELEKVRRDIKRLKDRIASLDQDCKEFIDVNGDPGPSTELIVDEAEAQAKWDALAEEDKTSRAFARLYFAPPETWTLPVALSAMAKLDAAIVLTIKQAIEASDQLPATGRIPNVEARNVAYVVAQYLQDVTGSPPALWTGANPSGRFAHALLDIFRIMGIKADIQRPGEWATAKLKGKPEF